MIPGFGPEIITTSEILGYPTRHARAVHQRSDLMKFESLINRYSRIDAKVKRDNDPVLLLRNEYFCSAIPEFETCLKVLL